MPIASRTNRGVLILEPGGKLTIGRGEVEFDRAVEEVVETEAPKILVNLRQVDVIDSSALAAWSPPTPGPAHAAAPSNWSTFRPRSRTSCTLPSSTASSRSSTTSTPRSSRSKR